MQAGAESDTAREHRQVLTPEGVPVGVALAGRGERAAALVVDLVIMAAGPAVILLLFAIAGFGFGPVAAALVILLYAVVRMGYFAFFEAAWNGATPGKRVLGLRVVNRHGGRLTFEQVLARTLMREIEVFIPLGVILDLGTGPGGSIWIDVALAVWAGTFLLVPWLNADRMRAGDFFAGTWVVVPAKVALGAEVAAPANAEPAMRFTDAQLSVYGEFELQVLEDVLRRRGTGPESREARTRRAVAERIAAKIGFDRALGDEDVEPFLEAYYAALRQRLESGMLHGRRIADKHEANGKS